MHGPRVRRSRINCPPRAGEAAHAGCAARSRRSPSAWTPGIAAQAVSEHTRLQLRRSGDRAPATRNRAKQERLAARAGSADLSPQGRTLAVRAREPALLPHGSSRDDLLGKPRSSRRSRSSAGMPHVQSRPSLTSGEPSVAERDPVAGSAATGETVERRPTSWQAGARRERRRRRTSGVRAFSGDEQIGARRKAEAARALELSRAWPRRLRAEQALAHERGALPQGAPGIAGQRCSPRTPGPALARGCATLFRQVRGARCSAATRRRCWRDPEAARSLDRPKARRAQRRRLAARDRCAAGGTYPSISTIDRAAER